MARHKKEYYETIAAESEYAKTQKTEDYSSRKILVWLQNQELSEPVQDYLHNLLPLAAIRVVDSEEKAFEQAAKGEWNTFVVDVQEEGVSDSEFVKAANNNLEVALVALDYENLGKEEETPVQLDQIRKLFDFSKKMEPDEESEIDPDDE